jgi:acyl-coenzyme A synthetase/AMP-(fatty) acid ligase
VAAGKLYCDTPSGLHIHTQLTFFFIDQGGIASPANPAYSVKELSHQVSLSEAKVIICVPSNVNIALETAAKCGISLSHLFVFGDDATQGVQPYTQVLLSGRHLATPVPISNPSEQPSYMCFSSGTTGLSKGVIST